MTYSVFSGTLNPIQSTFSVNQSTVSALTLLVGRQEGRLACKKWGDGGGGHWLVRME